MKFCRIVMKKAVIIFLSVIIVFTCILPVSAAAEDISNPIDEITEQIDSILDDYDIGFNIGDIDNLSLTEIIESIKNHLVSHLYAPLQILCSIFIVIICSTLTNNAVSKSTDIYNMVCVMAAVTVIAPQLISVYGETLYTIQVGSSFILVFVPLFTAVSVISGGFTSAGVYHMMMLGASELIVKLSESYLLPILSVISAFAVTGSVFPNASLDSMVNLLKKAVTWGISITMSLFVGFVTLKCTITGKADGAAAKTAKMLVSGFVPIVGGAVSDAYSTVKGSFDVINGAVGAVGIIAIVMIMLPKILEIFVYRLVMWIGSAVADIFSADAVSKLLKSFDSGLAIAQSILICYGVIFILCSAILMQTF